LLPLQPPPSSPPFPFLGGPPAMQNTCTQQSVLHYNKPDNIKNKFMNHSMATVQQKTRSINSTVSIQMEEMKIPS
jgi:hypothetical protein